MKVKNLLLGIVVIVAIGLIVFFAMKMTKEIKNNGVNEMNAVEVQSEEVVEDATNTIEEKNIEESNDSEESKATDETEAENKTEENTVNKEGNTTEKGATNSCGCGCGTSDDSCCGGDPEDC